MAREKVRRHVLAGNSRAAALPPAAARASLRITGAHVRALPPRRSARALGRLGQKPIRRLIRLLALRHQRALAERLPARQAARFVVLGGTVSWPHASTPARHCILAACGVCGARGERHARLSLLQKLACRSPRRRFAPMARAHPENAPALRVVTFAADARAAARAQRTRQRFPGERRGRERQKLSPAQGRPFGTERSRWRAAAARHPPQTFFISLPA